ncbi:MAG: hypothetical protein E7331_11095 [Clostridiales bacterium]|nr:hypothetical protein [Clostridiales bacterium]
MKKWIALLLSLCMLLSTAALAETVTEEAPAQESAVAADTLDENVVLATVYGEEITWGEIAPLYEELVLYYGLYYDMADPANVNLFRALALDTCITQKVLDYKSVELNMTLTDEEKAQAEADAKAVWDGAITEYVTGNEGATEDDAVAFYNEQGYTLETLIETYVEMAVEDKLYASIIQDVVVTDEDVEAYYQELVAQDKEEFGNDVSAYINYNNYVDQMSYYYGAESGMEYSWYRPAGFRQVKHILLPVDETLMATYLDLQARFEEQMLAEEAVDGEAPEAAEAPEATEGEAAAEPVTQAQLDEAKAAILDSVSDTVVEINDKFNNGTSFDELMAEYSMDYHEGYSNVYEVSVASSLILVPEFVEATFSIENIGDVSAPYVSRFGVHIVYYEADIPEGPIEMTDAQREAKREQLLQIKQQDAYTATVEGWIADADIVYTGVTPSLEEVLAEMEAEDEAPVEEETTEETPAEETPAEETSEEAPAEETPTEEVPAE